MSNATAVSAGLFKTLPYDAEKDLTPLSVLGTFDIAIVVPQESKFASLQDLLSFAKANPGKLNIGSINVGSTQHLAAELFKATAGIDVQVVPFNGTPAVLTALRGGQIDLAVEILAPVLPQIKGQALRALAVTGDKRSAALPQVPTAKEAGIRNLYAASWNALAVPSKTPRDIVQKLNQEIQSVLNSADVRKKLLDMNVDPQPGSLQQAADLLSSETKRWGEVIQRAGIPKQ
jgi:tripartite-type tricarboxylate transporter receptor subunit TctC